MSRRRAKPLASARAFPAGVFPAFPARAVRLAAAALPALLAAAFPAPLTAAQQPLPRDTGVVLDSLIVTAERARTRLQGSAASVSVITGAQLRAVPGATIADALRQVPGFSFVDQDGLGHAPQLMVRGFHGGGETEHVVVLLDGRILNDVQSGLVAWEAIPAAEIERIEVVRGGTSPLWGDAATGGVINVVTREVAQRTTTWSLKAGSHDTWRGSGEIRGETGGRAISVFGAADRTAGFREHSGRRTGRAGGSIALADGGRGSLRLTAQGHWREHDEPGPLRGSDRAEDRTASDIFYRFDGTTDRQYRLALDGGRELGRGARLSGTLTGERHHADRVSTLELAPGFADTQERVLGTGRGIANVQVSLDGTGLPVSDRLVLGFDGSYATLDSEYYAVHSGTREDYDTATFTRGERNVAGSGDRIAAAAFAQYSLLPIEAVRVTAGMRADWLRDRYEPRGDPAEDALSSKHVAWSPRLGVNVEYQRGVAGTGNVYFTASRSFKAPTLDQLFDQRTMPVPFPPFTVAISNALLEPQHGVNYEAGVYHGATILPGRLSGDLSLSVYQMDMENEIDFDLQALSYVNIGRSRHRGVEAGVQVRGPGASTGFLNYTLQHATQRVGEDAGRFLKAIPRTVVSAGGTLVPVAGLEVGFVVSHARSIHLDDANTIELPPYTRADARLAYPVAGVHLFLEVRNVLDSHHSTTGFPDPGGTDATYFRPAAGRTFELGVRSGY